MSSSPMPTSVSRQPAYRRPSWAQRDKSYEHYMRKDLAIDRSPGHDFGMENFSYDEAHLSKWQMPDDLKHRLPTELKNTATDWQYAGAALCTALDRLAKLDDQSLHRGYPEKSLSHLSRSSSISPTTSGGAGIDTPPLSSPVSPSHVGLKSSLLPLEKLSQLDSFPPRHMLGMETPPFTPVDCQVCPTPEVPSDAPGWTPHAPDVQQLTRQLCREARTDSVTGTGAVGEVGTCDTTRPQMTGSFTSTTSSAAPSSAPLFDETAWETFVKVYQAELHDVRTNAWPRLKGCGHTVDTMRTEKGLETEWHDAVEHFNAWWASMKPQLAEYEDKAKRLDVPTLERVQTKRRAQGLSV